MQYILLLIIVVMTQTCNSSAKTYPFKVYSDDIVPDIGDFSGMMQDSRGIIWIWGTDGVAFYDGSRFSYLGQNDGLLDNHCYKVIESPKGEMYIGTYRGLSIYNFNTGKIHNHMVHTDGPVRDICFYRDGFFMAWDGGVDWVKGNGAYRVILPHPTKIESIQLMVNEIEYDSVAAKIWIATDRSGVFSIMVDSLWALNEMKNKSLALDYERLGLIAFEKLHPNIVSIYTEGINPLIRLIDPHGMGEGDVNETEAQARININRYKFLSIDDPYERMAISRRIVQRFDFRSEIDDWPVEDIIISSDGSIIAISAGRLFQLKEGQFKDISDNYKKYIKHIVDYNENAFGDWHITGNLGCLTTLDGDTLFMGLNSGLVGNIGIKYLRDHQGFIWLAEQSTHTISKLNSTDINIYSKSELAILDDIISMVNHPDGYAIIICEDGIGIYKNKSISQLEVKPIYPDNIQGAIVDKLGNLLLFTVEEMYSINLNTGIIVKISDIPVYRGDIEYDIGPDGIVWIALSGHLFSWDGKLLTSIDDLASGKLYEPICIEITPDTTIIVGTWNGFIKYKDGKKWRYDHFEILHPNGDLRQFTKGWTVRDFATTCVQTSTQNAFWLGTFSSGLIRGKGDSLKNFTTKDGLPSDKYTSVTKDANGDLYFVYNKGVVKVDENGFHPLELNLPESASIQSITIDKEGRKYLSTSIGLMVIDSDKSFILNNDFGLREKRVKAVLLSEEGDVIVAQANGLYSFSSGELFKKSIPKLNPLITEIWVESMRVDISKEIILPSNQRTLIIKFSLPDYISEEQNLYSWRLSDLDHSYSKPSAQNMVEYSNLHPGNYEFNLISWNAFGKESNLIIPLQISVPYRFAETWLFKIMVIVLAVGVGYSFVRFRIWRVQARNKMLQEKVKQRTMELEMALVKLQSAKNAEIETAKLKSIQKLAGGIAHELNQPLQALYGVADIIEVKNPNPTDIENHLKIIPKAVERISALVKQMLAITTFVEKDYTKTETIIDLEKSSNIAHKDSSST